MKTKQTDTAQALSAISKAIKKPYSKMQKMYQEKDNRFALSSDGRINILKGGKCESFQTSF